MTKARTRCVLTVISSAPGREALDRHAPDSVAGLALGRYSGNGPDFVVCGRQPASTAAMAFLIALIV